MTPARPQGGTFRALRHRNFRDYFTGQAVSLIGTWVQTTAIAWLVWRLTGSNAQLGWINFIGRIPALFVSPVIGVFVDRHSRRALTILAQQLQMAQALMLALLTLGGWITIHWIEALSFLLGLCAALDVPARQALMIELVGKEDLPNAIPLNSGLFNLCRAIGPLIAGLFLGLGVSEGICFLANGLSYVVVIWLLMRMDLPDKRFPRQEGNVAQHIGEALVFVRQHTAVRDSLLYMAIVGMFGYGHSVVLPSIADEVMGRDAGGFGILLGASGAGAILGAVYLARGALALQPGVRIVISGSILGASLILFSFTRTFWLATFLLVPAGAGMMVQSAVTNTLLQTVVPDHLRGRIMSFYSTVFLGLFPVGCLIIGFVAEKFGPMFSIRLAGCLCVGGAVILFARSRSFQASVDRLRGSVGAADAVPSVPIEPAD